MIEITLKGGLGNQLFQYALGRHLSIINKTGLTLDITDLLADPMRNYRLDSFNIPSDICIKYYGLTNKILSALGLVNKQTIFENSFEFNRNILKCPMHIKLDGYWQTENYFKDIESVIRDDLTLKRTMPLNLLALKEQIESSNSVSLHVRRGDYASNPATNAYHGLCPLEWYINAAMVMSEMVGKAHFYIFTDDELWAKSNIKFNAPITFVPKGRDGEEAFDLTLMSCCKNNIIANSSFSWWGAWLNKNQSKRVIAPTKWFQGAAHQTKDLIPKEWIKL